MMKKNIQKILLITWIIVIFVLTAIPSLETPKLKGFPMDKVYHFIAFFILGLLEFRLMKTKIFFAIGCGVTLLAEFQQIFIPGRDFEILDIGAGIFGLIIIYIILISIRSARHDLSKA